MGGDDDVVGIPGWNMGVFHGHGGYPQQLDGLEWKISFEWMITRGTPICGNLQICFYCCWIWMFQDWQPPIWTKSLRNVGIRFSYVEHDLIFFLKTSQRGHPQRLDFESVDELIITPKWWKYSDSFNLWLREVYFPVGLHRWEHPRYNDHQKAIRIALTWSVSEWQLYHLAIQISRWKMLKPGRLVGWFAIDMFFFKIETIHLESAWKYAEDTWGLMRLKSLEALWSRFILRPSEVQVPQWWRLKCHIPAFVVDVDIKLQTWIVATLPLRWTHQLDYDVFAKCLNYVLNFPAVEGNDEQGYGSLYMSWETLSYGATQTFQTIG